VLPVGAACLAHAIEVEVVTAKRVQMLAHQRRALAQHGASNAIAANQNVTPAEPAGKAERASIAETPRVPDSGAWATLLLDRHDLLPHLG
jgi:hypothetical protein